MLSVLVAGCFLVLVHGQGSLMLSEKMSGSSFLEVSKGCFGLSWTTICAQKKEGATLNRGK